MIGDTATRVLLAVVNQRRPTVRSVAEEVGCAISTAHDWLVKLRDEGLVTWAEDRRGTLRSNVRLIDPNVCSGCDGGQHTSDPRTARTAGGLVEPCKGGSDMRNHSSPVSRSCEGRR